MNDSYVLYAGWLFFAAWSAVVFAVSLVAFGPDIFSSNPLPNASQEINAADPHHAEPDPS